MKVSSEEGEEKPNFRNNKQHSSKTKSTLNGKSVVPFERCFANDVASSESGISRCRSKTKRKQSKTEGVCMPIEHKPKDNEESR